VRVFPKSISIIYTLFKNAAVRGLAIGLIKYCLNIFPLSHYLGLYQLRNSVCCPLTFIILFNQLQVSYKIITTCSFGFEINYSLCNAQLIGYYHVYDSQYNNYSHNIDDNSTIFPHCAIFTYRLPEELWTFIKIDGLQ
jgi:hypothetical protein